MKKVERKIIPNNLRVYRKALGMNQSEVARILNMKSRGVISRWEKGESLPNLENALRLSALYTVLVNALFQPLYFSIKRRIMSRQAALRRWRF